MATGDRSNGASGHSRVNILVVAIAATLLASACAATARGQVSRVFGSR
jgi:hypothetical protein